MFGLLLSLFWAIYEHIWAIYEHIWAIYEHIWATFEYIFGYLYRAKQILAGYADLYKTRFMETFRRKLGIQGNEDEDEYLVALLLQVHVP